MRLKSKLMLIVGAVLSVASFAACGSTGGTSETGGGGNTGCTPGVQQACACIGGTMGIQVCNDDGRGFAACQCGTSSSSSSSSGSTSSSSGSSGSCGDGIKQDSDHCESPSSEFYCKSDCMGGTGGTGGGGGTGGSCAGHVYYAGKFTMPADNAVWATLPGAGGLTGLDAGNNQCKALGVGADHVCDYEEVLKAQAQGELAAITQGTTAWVQRTTVAMVNGQPSQPGPGGRCNDWTYATNHISDGEYITFEQQGVPTFHLDNDTVFDANAPGVHTVGDLPCGGVSRSILCCYQACE